MIKLNSVVIVEGKYDKIHLENYLDAVIVTTDGFGIYKNKNKQALIRRLSEENGVVIITDSDHAGAQIRAFIKSICDPLKITNVYLPQIHGKEKRKTMPSKQGFLGAEGISGEIIIDALNRFGVCSCQSERDDRITKSDLFSVGLSGGENSKSARAGFAKYLNLPPAISSNAFLDALNTLYTKEEFYKEVNSWRQVQVRN